MNIADLVVILIIIIFAFIGYKRGLLLGLYSFGSYLIAIFLGFILRKPVTAFINYTPIPEKIHNNVLNKLIEFNEAKAGETTVKAKEYIEGLNYPTLIENFLKKNIDNLDTDRLFVSLAEEISDKVTAFIVGVLAFLVTVIVVLIIMLFLKMLIKTARKLPVIKQVDGLGGLVLGAIEGTFVICIMVLVLYLFSARESFEPIIKAVESSVIAKFFFEKNLLASILSELKLLIIFNF